MIQIPEQQEKTSGIGLPLSKAPSNNLSNITRLLLLNWHAGKIAKHLNLTPATISYYTTKLVRDGVLECYFKTNTKFYRTPMIIKHVRESLSYSPLLDKIGQKPEWFPKKIGAIFTLNKRPPLKYDIRGKAEHDEANFHVQFGRIKAQVWVKSFEGKTWNEKLDNSCTFIMQVAQYMHDKYDTTMVFERWYPDVEAVQLHEGIGKFWAERLGIIAKGGKVQLGPVLAKYDDGSDTDKLQLNAKREPVSLAVQESEKLFTGEFTSRTDKLLVVVEAQSKTLEKLTDGMVQIRQWIELRR